MRSRLVELNRGMWFGAEEESGSRVASVVKERARWRVRVLAGAFCACLVLVLVVSAPGRAASLPGFLWQTPEDGLAGTGVGQFDNPDSGLVADPVSGHVFVGDSRNARVVELDAWGQFVKAWGWGVADGADELQTCGPQASPPTSTCLKGLEGSGAGQFKQLLGGIALDGAGDVYVGDMANHRIEKFDSAGHFLLAFGEQGNGPGQFETSEFGTYIAVGPSGTVFVGDVGRVEEFNSNGTFKSEIPFTGELAKFKGKPVESLAVDSAENIYLTAANTEEVLKVSPDGPTLVPPKSFPISSFNAFLTVDPEGNLYVTSAAFKEVVEFGPSGNEIIAPGSEFASVELVSGLANGAIQGLAANSVTSGGGVDLYAMTINGTSLSFVKAYGPPPDKWLPPAFPPEIDSQYAAVVDPDAAVVRAQINPRFWADTSYMVEYGTGKCSEGGCSGQHLARLEAGILQTPVTTSGVVLAGLSPGTTYHYRFVAQSSGGGPVRGTGGTVLQDGAENVFTTPVVPSLPSVDPCANAALRAGPAEFLPDCRAYEMVSPVEKNGGDVIPVSSFTNVPASLDVSALGGGRFGYSAYRAFGDARSAPLSSQYIATRGATGWVTHGISPTRETEILDGGVAGLDVEYSFFSPDLCNGWLRHTSDPPLSAEAVEGFTNLYRQSECGTEAFEAVTTTPPPNVRPGSFTPELQGVSADGTHAIYIANDVLAPGAPTLGNERFLYDETGGRQRYVCVLPNGTPLASACTAGSGVASVGGNEDNREEAVSHAISDDGSRVYWMAGGSSDSSAPLYLRVHPEQAQSKIVSGACTEPERACTFPVSHTAEEASKTKGSQFWTASPDGSKALFSTGDLIHGLADLYEFDAGSGETHLIAHRIRGLLGASEDISHIFFVSEEALAGEAKAGHPNLYFYQAGVGMRFITTVADADAQAFPFFTWSAASVSPLGHTARVTADGLQVVFMSSASLTGYDNVDVNSGQPDAEVYLYDVTANGGTGALRCLSCNPTGARPNGRPVELRVRTVGVWTAGAVPGWASQLYQQRYLSDNGRRAFFDSYDALTSRDTNGKEDVYEWEAPGEGDCTEASQAFSPVTGGCVSLISSGESRQDSEFVDASADGSEVFFSTATSLLPQDPGLIDIYDARIGGGFPQPVRTSACEGEACQNPSIPLIDSTPGSLTFSGTGNIIPPGASNVLAKKSKTPPSSAQRLAKALRACRSKRPHRKRTQCEAQARKRYAVKASRARPAKPVTHAKTTKGQGRR